MVLLPWFLLTYVLVSKAGRLSALETLAKPMSPHLVFPAYGGTLDLRDDANRGLINGHRRACLGRADNNIIDLISLSNCATPK
jgi:hypothetical protein